MSFPCQNNRPGFHNLRRPLLLVSLMLLTALSCSLPRTLFETFVSPGDLDPQAVSTWEEHYADGEGVVVEEDAPTEEPRVETQPDAGGKLTPQQLKNEGTHNYQITGSATPMLGGDGKVQDNGTCSSVFSEGGVQFQFMSNPPGFFNRVGENQYEQVTDSGTQITLTYTDTGLLYNSVQENGVFLDMELTLDD
ncbi:MAG: hypothetical protein V2I46_01480 [Bacteroides sp.]|jgi:hypothetical protein|nr:hypothetical protein [Bacteroides sp.]